MDRQTKCKFVAISKLGKCTLRSVMSSQWDNFSFHCSQCRPPVMFVTVPPSVGCLAWLQCRPLCGVWLSCGAALCGMFDLFTVPALCGMFDLFTVLSFVMFDSFTVLSSLGRLTRLQCHPLWDVWLGYSAVLFGVFDLVTVPSSVECLTWVQCHHLWLPVLGN